MQPEYKSVCDSISIILFIEIPRKRLISNRIFGKKICILWSSKAFLYSCGVAKYTNWEKIQQLIQGFNLVHLMIQTFEVNWEFSNFHFSTNSQNLRNSIADLEFWNKTIDLNWKNLNRIKSWFERTQRWQISHFYSDLQT